ncbi:MAG: GNAT family N-acetyltransferase [Ornithinimicrobium sp.]
MSHVTSAYRWGHLRADTVDEWADLNNILARVDDTDEFLEAEDLLEDLDSPSFDAPRDSWTIWSGPDLVGIGRVLVPEALSNEGLARTYLLGGVHPDYRGQGIGRRLIEAQERRGWDLAQQRHPGHPTAWFADGGIPGASVRALLSRRGYEIARYFAHMVRPVRTELASAELSVPATGLPAGVVLITPDPSMSEELRHLHNVAFEDHWGSGARTEQAWREARESRTARTQFSSVAVDRDGQPLAYVWAAQWTKRELYIDAVGTAPSARHRGLARACLARTLALAAASGDYDLVDLGVDAASLTGATRLYEQLGFTVDRTFALYSRPMPSVSEPA